MGNHTLADYCLALRTEIKHLDIGDVNATVTALSHHAKNFLKSPRGTMTRIEAFVILTAGCLLYLAMFGSWRRKSRNFMSQTAVLAAYTFSSSLIAYSLGSMQSSPVKSSMYPVWAISLYILLGSADSITAYNLIDHQQSNRLIYRFLPDVLYVVFIALTLTSPTLIFLLFVIASLKVVHRVCASQLAMYSWNLNKMVADYMDRQEHSSKSGSSYCDPVSMEGYHYLVDWPLRDSKLGADTSYGTELTNAADIIDIQSVFLSKDKSLSQELKDACLSFSLCHLLRRRFYGFTCVESTRQQQQAHDFVFKGLLHKNNEVGTINYERVFRVIEIELAFIYDFFFTKHAVLYYGSWAATFWSLAFACFMCVAAYLVAIRAAVIVSTNGLDVSSLFSTSTLTIDFVITVVMLASIVLLEVVHQVSFWTSIWGRVSFVCHRVREEASDTKGRSRRICWCVGFLRVKFKEILARIGLHVWRRSSYWQHKLGQYSLLESVDTTPSALNLITFTAACVRKVLRFVYLVEFAAIHHVSDHHQLSVRKAGDPIDLTPQLKEALVKSLAGSEGRILTNGRSSLDSNGVAGDLAWACDHPDWGTSSIQRKGNQVFYILTWHIATCYCEMGEKYQRPSVDVGGPLKDVATKLSRYCAYLVVFAPRLLPGNHYDTVRVFDAVAMEAITFLKGQQRDKYEAMKGWQISSVAAAPGQKEKIFDAGVRLGRQLEKMEVRWKVLADFWAEMMLYVAPSGNFKEHVECLARGGEFVTHLWALLFHAGIVNKQAEENHHVGSV